MYHDYFSIAYANRDAAEAAIIASGLRTQVGTFFIDGRPIYRDDADIIGPFQQGANWYFNVRSPEVLTGAWIGAVPSTPYIGWAGGAYVPPVTDDTTIINTSDGKKLRVVTIDENNEPQMEVLP